MNGETFQQIISGRSRTLSAFGWRILFRGISYPYRFGVVWKNRLYDQEWIAPKRLHYPVVSVGNLTLGGTGKTPMIAYLAEYLTQIGKKPAVLSRGYGAEPHPVAGPNKRFAKHNDEWTELNERLGNLPHYQDKDRFAAGLALEEDFPDRNLFLLDDGFQYRRLYRDFDIILLDATEPFGYNALFPRGFLREPVESLRRADAVLLSRADLVSVSDRENIRKQVEKTAPGKIWGEIRHCPSMLVRSGQPISREPLAAEKIGRPFAFCGIGNPKGFFSMLDREKISLTGQMVFPDHHAYSESDRDYFLEQAEKSGADLLLTTMKDFVKLRRFSGWPVPVAAVEIGIEFLVGEEPFQKRLLSAVSGS